MPKIHERSTIRARAPWAVSPDLHAPGRLDWMQDGTCGEVDGDLWFPEKGDSSREVKAVCAGCPVRTECLEYALANDERFGVWGGTSEKERRRIKRQRARARRNEVAA